MIINKILQCNMPEDWMVEGLQIKTKKYTTFAVEFQKTQTSGGEPPVPGVRFRA